MQAASLTQEREALAGRYTCANCQVGNACAVSTGILCLQLSTSMARHVMIQMMQLLYDEYTPWEVDHIMQAVQSFCCTGLAKIARHSHSEAPHHMHAAHNSTVHMPAVSKYQAVMSHDICFS